MEEYVMTFAKFRNHCKHPTAGVHGYRLTTRYACGKKLTMDWVHSKNPARYIECREKVCPILNKCETIIK